MEHFHNYTPPASPISNGGGMDPGQFNLDQLDNKQRLRLSILHGTRAVCKVVEESLNPQMSFDKDASAVIGELVWRKLQEMGSDLECFAKHAKRSTIKSPDVLLLTRRNSSLTDHLQKLVKPGEKRKRKSDGTSANAGTSGALNDFVNEINLESNDGTSSNAAPTEELPTEVQENLENEFNMESDDVECLLDNFHADDFD